MKNMQSEPACGPSVNRACRMKKSAWLALVTYHFSPLIA